MKNPAKPSRTDLLGAIALLQDLVGEAATAAGNDRHPERAAAVAQALTSALAVCIQARRHDDPQAGSRSKWAADMRRRIRREPA
ncbi:hypothetical protein [Thalassobaculum sp.]|uniref:hypothetical protein n=1 Tax=Thalassobaculum sp. TaxID=2022740 RepID=UPI0032EB1BD4